MTQQPNPSPIQVNLTPVNLTAELQKVHLSDSLTRDQHADLRTLILDAAAAIGMDGSGRDGLLGYLKYAASTFPKQYLQVIAKVLPLQIDSKSTINVIEHVNIVSVPSDRYMPRQAFANEKVEVPVSDLADNLVDITDLNLDATSDAIQTIEDVLNNPTPVVLPDDDTLPDDAA